VGLFLPANSRVTADSEERFNAPICQNARLWVEHVEHENWTRSAGHFKATIYPPKMDGGSNLRHGRRLAFQCPQAAQNLSGSDARHDGRGQQKGASAKTMLLIANVYERATWNKQIQIISSLIPPVIMIGDKPPWWSSRVSAS